MSAPAYRERRPAAAGSWPKWTSGLHAKHGRDSGILRSTATCAAAATGGAPAPTLNLPRPLSFNARLFPTLNRTPAGAIGQAGGRAALP